MIGFRGNFRFTYDHESLEIDLVNAEVCLPCADEAKICHDESKLLRESMISTEVIHHILSHEDFIYTWNIRVSGLTAVFSKVLYDDDQRIYVNVDQFTVFFPTCISELEDLKEELELLFKFKEDVKRIASKVQRTLKQTERRRNQDYSPVRNLPLYQVHTSPHPEKKRNALFYPSINNNSNI